MVVSHITLIAQILLLTDLIFGMQITPGSPCATKCGGGSSTTGDEIACQDTSFNNTAVGQNFKSCLSCLQNSTFSAGAGGDDQTWFLYNMRYALSTCLFKFANNSDAISTPCSAPTVCGPLKGAIEYANLVPENEKTYSYCSADEYVIMSGTESKCTTCLRNDPELYLSNFVAALKGACMQQPPAGTMIGFSGSVFTNSEITPTFPGDNPLMPAKKKKSVLSHVAIIGITVGVIGFLVLVLLILYLYSRKLRKQRMKSLNSNFDERFGAPNITSPNAGAFGNPYGDPQTKAAPLQYVAGGHSRDASTDERMDFSDKERKGSWQGQLMQIQNHARPSEMSPRTVQVGSPPHGGGLGMPTHQAYIPTSPTGSHSTQFSLSPLPSAQASPDYPPHLRPPPLAATAGPPPPPTTRKSPRYPPRIQTRNHGLGTTLTSPGGDENVNGYGRSDFELANRERREREQRGEVIRPLEKWRRDLTGNGKRKKKEWSPHSAGSERDSDSLW